MATYTTSEKIRVEAGFQGNTDITDTDIDSQRNRAYAHINSKVGARYALPVETQNANWDGSPAKELLASIELMLWAAFMLIQEYWNEALGSDKDGYRKAEYVRSMLDDIVAGQLVLFASDWSELKANAKFWVEQGGMTPDSFPQDEDPTFTKAMIF